MTGFVVHGHVWGYSCDVNKHRRIIHADAGYSVVRGGAGRSGSEGWRLGWIGEKAQARLTASSRF